MSAAVLPSFPVATRGPGPAGSSSWSSWSSSSARLGASALSTAPRLRSAQLTVKWPLEATAAAAAAMALGASPAPLRPPLRGRVVVHGGGGGGLGDGGSSGETRRASANDPFTPPCRLPTPPEKPNTAEYKGSVGSLVALGLADTFAKSLAVNPLRFPARHPTAARPSGAL